MEFILISIAAALFCMHLTKRCLQWIELTKYNSPYLRIAVWLGILSLPVLAIATRFNVFDIVSLMHHLPRSGFIQFALLSEAALLLACWISLEVKIINLEKTNKHYEQVH